MESSTIAIIITIITIISFVLEKIPLAMTAMIASLAMGIILPEMKLADVYSGFSSTTVMMVAGMCVVGDALFKTGMANKIGKAIGGSSLAKNERMFTIAVVICCTIMSSFLSNSGTIAMWMPLIAAVAAKSHGAIRSKMVILAAGIACAVGGAGTLVGSTSQQTANAVLMGVAGYEDGLSLFDQTKIMIPLCLIMIVYFATVGYSLTKKVLKPESPDFDKGNYYADLASKTSDETQNDNVKDYIERGLLDIGLMLDAVDICKYEFVSMPVKERWGVLVCKDSELAHKEQICPEDLKNIPLIMSAGEFPQSKLTKWLGSYAQSVEIAARGNLLYNEAMLAASNIGVVICIQLNCTYDGLRFIPLFPAMETETVLAWKKDQTYSAATAAFIDHAKKYLKGISNNTI